MAMAARDEKISNNRRRLFKALSAAPVVATLKPGSALATSSAYQCLSSGHDIKDWHQHNWPHINNPCSGGGEPCYAYVERNYLDITEGRKVKNKTCPSMHNIIVEVGGDGSEDYMDWNGGNVSLFVAKYRNAHNKRKIVNSAGDTCIRNIPVRRGLFAKVGHAGSDQTSFQLLGTAPEYKIGGGYQGITGTCLNSVMPGARAHVLSRG